MKKGIADTYIWEGYLIVVTLNGEYYKIKAEQIPKPLVKK